ncbi:MAG TPA: TIGR03790 family protein [Bryobacteraceae bacterium]|nr:TIGR03790 family protein [Bryobacteraceae bacterium]
MCRIRYMALAVTFLTALNVLAAGPESVLLILNTRSTDSLEIGKYYVAKRAIPERNVCKLSCPTKETIDHATYQRDIAKPVASCLQSQGLTESVLYLVTTLGVPLRVARPAAGKTSTSASVDSELTLLYSDLRGSEHPLPGPLENPFFRQRDTPFTHPRFPIYLVSRLAAYDVATVKRMIDSAAAAGNRGKFVIDMRNKADEQGNDWLRNAAILIPDERLVFDETDAVLYEQKDVIGYAAWGSNDHNRHRRWVNFSWLPGAIVTEYVSTNARTFAKPPEKWTIGAWRDNPASFFADSPQTMIADYLAEGATGAAGHVDEPYRGLTPRPDLLFPAYYNGRNLIESFWLSIPALSWQNIVLGDPLCTLGRPQKQKGR